MAIRDRHEHAGELEDGRRLTTEYARDILNAVHPNMLTTYTLYSDVVDLRNKVIYLNYMSQYGETASLDVAEELSGGARVISMRELFSDETAQAGDLAYERFEQRFTAAKIGMINVAVGILVGFALLAARVLRNQLEVAHG